MAIIYNDRHEHDDVYYFTKNPDMVLVDSKIIASAPVRYLVAGMGDAMATAFEARATIAMDSNNYICQESGCYRRTRTAEVIAESSDGPDYSLGFVTRAEDKDAEWLRELVEAARCDDLKEYFKEAGGTLIPAF